MNILKIFGLAMGALLLLIVGSVAAVWAPDRSVEDLAARWAPTPSQFVMLEGLKS